MEFIVSFLRGIIERGINFCNPKKVNSRHVSFSEEPPKVERFGNRLDILDQVEVDIKKRSENVFSLLKSLKGGVKPGDIESNIIASIKGFEELAAEYKWLSNPQYLSDNLEAFNKTLEEVQHSLNTFAANLIEAVWLSKDFIVTPNSPSGSPLLTKERYTSPSSLLRANSLDGIIPKKSKYPEFYNYLQKPDVKSNIRKRGYDVEEIVSALNELSDNIQNILNFGKPANDLNPKGTSKLPYGQRENHKAIRGCATYKIGC